MAGDDTNDEGQGSSAFASASSANRFILNPYQGDIFPGDFTGSKLYRAAIKGPDTDEKRFTLSIENGSAIMASLRKASRDFVWNKITIVPAAYDSRGNPLTLVNLLDNPEQVALTDVQIHAGKSGVPSIHQLRLMFP